jgi:vancomycin resistance protein YoaR
VSARAPSSARQVRRAAPPVVRTRHVKGLVASAGLVVLAIGIGAVFAGSPGKLAGGTHVAGIDVGGLTPREAQALLEKRSASLARIPVTFVVGSRTFSIRPDELSVTSDWAQAVAAAAAKGDGVSVVRGFRRLALRLSPENVTPKARAYTAAVNYEVGLMAAKVDQPDRPARLIRHGAQVDVIPARAGEVLDRKTATTIVINALASLERSGPVALPTSVAEPTVTAADLDGARITAEKALSAPVTLTLGQHRFKLEPKQLAPMLQLPSSAGGSLVLGGSAANAYFAKLDSIVGQPASGAKFSATGDHVTLVPAKPGVSLDVPRTAAAVLAAAEKATHRVAPIAVSSISVGRTTEAAQAMGITGVVGSFETDYGGVANRIHNVQLVAHLVDGKYIAPGATFSFNKATGARTAAKGFLEAPVIIDGELSNGLGGGVCQVSTTVFNAAYEAGLPITDRTNHALYISHYPLGRDATVDYPDVDLKFVNDTGHWLLLRTFVGPSSLVVTLYGTPQDRRVVSDTAPLRVVAAPPVQRKFDGSLKPGERVVEDPGSPALSTSVRRDVYDSSGKLLSEATWYSNYRSTPKIVLVGPKPKPKLTPVTPVVPAFGSSDHQLQ